MRHMKGMRKFNRTSSHRMAMFRNMLNSLLVHGRITTTDLKAKELRRIAERLITLSKRVESFAAEGEESKLSAAELHAVRQARRWINDRVAFSRLFREYNVRFKNRAGGYTRIVKVGFRPGDNTAMSMIEFLNDAPAEAPAAQA